MNIDTKPSIKFKQIEFSKKKIKCNNKEGFIYVCKLWFNIEKSIKDIHHNNKQKKKSHDYINSTVENFAQNSPFIHAENSQKNKTQPPSEPQPPPRKYTSEFPLTSQFIRLHPCLLCTLSSK